MFSMFSAKPIKTPLTILAVALLLLSASTLEAQKLSGVIKDAVTNETLAGANVVFDKNYGTTSDKEGLFRLDLSGVSRGTYTLKVTFIGYEPNSRRVEIPFSGELVILMQPEGNQLDQVVISAGKFRQQLSEITVSLDVIEPDLLDDKNQWKLEDLLQQAPGINITDKQANIRAGSGWSYGTGSRVQVLVDDIPLISGDAGQAQWDLIPTNAIGGMEIIKGASSVLYGSSALNGIINIITNPRPKKRSLTLNTYIKSYLSPSRPELKWWSGTQTEIGTNFNYQDVLSKDFSMVMSGYYRNDEGFRYLETENLGALFTKLYWTPSTNPNITASLAFRFKYADINDALLWEDYQNAYIPQDSNITHSFGWDYYIDPSLTIRSGRFLHQFKARVLAINNNVRNNVSNFSNFSDLYYGSYQLQFFESENGTITFGVAGNYTESESVVFQGTHYSSNFGSYVQLDYKIIDWLNFSGGWRLENFTLDDRALFKPVFRAGLSAQLLPNLALRTSFGQGFRFPAISETFTSTNLGGIVVYPNPELEAESGDNLEFGIRHLFVINNVKGYFDVAFYQMRYENMIEYTADFWASANAPNFGLGFRPLNIGNTEVRGIELSLNATGELWDKVNYRILAGYNYALPQVVDSSNVFAENFYGQGISYGNSSSNLDNRILKYRYSHLFKFDLQIDYDLYNIGFSVRTNSYMQNVDQIFEDFIAGVREGREALTSGDVLIDARMGMILGEHWKLDLLAENIANREVMIRPGFMGAPSSLSLRLKYSLDPIQ